MLHLQLCPLFWFFLEYLNVFVYFLLLIIILLIVFVDPTAHIFFQIIEMDLLVFVLRAFFPKIFMKFNVRIGVPVRVRNLWVLGMVVGIIRNWVSF